ncbi:response regulator transcription factor [Antarcticirhabdus aurantiaca]|uniref:response regulator transcription factor n=1 Tax=Antarcticirhabdus aurantiaca TaxID=2606717 RepID=UPI00131B333D|nr:LuxR C-terminal-related transcriptional regulator [Antarcticirhabdus aurantiaca]
MAQPLESPDGSLSPQMRRCFSLLAEGRTIGQIAAELYLSERGVIDLIEDARATLSARNRVHAVNIAIRKGLI